VAHPDRLLDRLRGREVTFIGDGAATYAAHILGATNVRATLADPIAPPVAGTIARLAAAAAGAGERPAPHSIRPLYVRRPDPELARDARLTG
jgi:tRNA A37 threonylcarbamoyladenosine modification protein TsaB